MNKVDFTVRNVTLHLDVYSLVYVNTRFPGQGSLSSSPSPPSGTTFPVLPVAVGVAVSVVLVVIIVVVDCCCRRKNDRKQLDSSRALFS